MPKEKISSPGPSEARTDPTTWVSWNRSADTNAGHVQLTVTCAPSYIRDLVAAVWDSDVLVSSGSLTRREVNRLISVLRRARDQAYGRDE
jgi:hypothetical protein